MKIKRLIAVILVLICFTALPFCETSEKKYNLSGKTYRYQSPYPELRIKAKECNCTLVVFSDFDYGRFYYECDYYEYDEGEARDTCRHVITKEFLKSSKYMSFRIKPIPLRHPTKDPESGQSVQRWEAYIEFLE